MYQTGYLGVKAFSTGIGYSGGFCKWYFMPKEYIATWPDIDPLTQYLKTEPTLIEGASWFGPIKIPNNQLGFQETLATSAAGNYYKQKVNGFYPGDSGNSRVNLENMPYHEWIIVGKQRAGGLYLILGDKERGLDFTTDYTTGPGAKKAAGTDFIFQTESLNRGLILPTFLGDNVTPPDDGSGDGGGGGGTTGGANETGIYRFYAADATKTIEWTPELAAQFGEFPEIQTWAKNEAGILTVANIPINVDDFPPDQTQFSFFLPGVDGLIVFK
jgi:hypothetical protein